MTDKQIMIDGVDVSECCNAEPTATTPKCTINNWIHCDGQNCYFKQLSRKTQECEYWKHQAELGSDTTDMLAKQIEEKEQECEELKKEINGYKTIIEKIRQEAQEDVTCESRECGKYKQTLGEIKYQVTELFLGAEDKDRAYCEKILDIINKAKEE